jgi:hypothetical protein
MFIIKRNPNVLPITRLCHGSYKKSFDANQTEFEIEKLQELLYILANAPTAFTIIKGSVGALTT